MADVGARCLPVQGHPGFPAGTRAGRGLKRTFPHGPQKEPSCDTLSSALWPPGRDSTPVTDVPFWGALFQWPLNPAGTSRACPVSQREVQ